MLLSFGLAVDADPLARVLLAELGAEVVVAEAAELVEDAETLQRELDPDLGVEAEEEPLPGGAEAQRLGEVGVGEVARVGEVGAVQLGGDPGESLPDGIVALGDGVEGAGGEGD